MNIALNDTDLFTAVFGAGAGSYPWYRRFNTNWDDLVADIIIEDPDNADNSIHRRLIPHDLRVAIEHIVTTGVAPNTASMRWSDPEVDSDVDADIADVIIQVAMLSDVAYG